MKLCNLDQQFVLNLTLVFYRYGYSKANNINYFEFFFKQGKHQNR